MGGQVYIAHSGHQGSNLLDKNGEALVLEGLGEVKSLGALRVDGEGRHNEVSLAQLNQLPYHAIPRLLGGVPL